ncbi:hypothetical protein IWQ60_006765 [Tieghemiomyces parasiticus]|uniref:Secreted protein n=1 Tax=Tieghemiomyces parasiticus TaxID=78921 RepID=A0A9W8DWE4_9FUNG|nr:hypothetical protein IWQ60_006765 [Tieghemiomyces parasiticus]
MKLYTVLVLAVLLSGVAMASPMPDADDEAFLFTKKDLASAMLIGANMAQQQGGGTAQAASELKSPA